MIYVFLANGFEETEAIAPIDILRRCELDVKTVGIGEEVVVSSHGIAVIPDITEVDFVPSDDIDMIVLPGGIFTDELVAEPFLPPGGGDHRQPL